MNVIVWGINYAPETTGIGPCTTALCRFLAERGHVVRVVTTFPYYPSWTKAAEHRRRWFQTNVIDNVHVDRCWHYVPRRVNTLRRILHEGSFVLTSFLRVCRLPRADLLVVVSPPLLLGPAAWFISRLCKIPLLFHVQDLQPDAAASLGLIKNRFLLRALLALERFSYAHATCLSGISQGMLSLFQAKGVPASKLLYFPNPVTAPAHLPAQGLFRLRHGFSTDKILAIYSGNFGQKQGLEVLIQAAPHLAGTNIHLVLCGEGAQRAHLTELIDHSKPSNISLLPLQSPEHYAEMMADADLCLIPQQAGTGQFFFPSKLLSALAHRKAVVAIADADSELVRLLRAHRFGLDVPPGDPIQLARVLTDAAQDRDRLRMFGQAGFKFIHQFEPDIVLSRIEGHLRKMVQKEERGEEASSERTAKAA
jgi:colanic acid biosynthesis glycosyl transferase WcaI